MVGKLESPCRDCEFRTVNCYSTCGEWKEYEAARNTEYALRKERYAREEYPLTAGKKAVVHRGFQYAKRKG